MNSGTVTPPWDSAPWTGGEVTPRATCILAPNPSPMTLEGTNTWVLLEPGGTDALVIDPGPLDEGHLAAVANFVAAQGARVAQTILTHGHADHSEAGPRFAELTGSRLRAVGRGHDDLTDGDVLTAGDLEVRVIATPGHTADSVSFAVAADHALLTGDTILGRGTTVVAHPDGELEAYLQSLETIKALTGDGEVVTILPGHGPTVPDATAMVDFYRVHRQERLEQVRAAVADGAITAQDVVERVYAEVPREVWPAALMSVQAQLTYLRSRG